MLKRNPCLKHWRMLLKIWKKYVWVTAHLNFNIWYCNPISKAKQGHKLKFSCPKWAFCHKSSLLFSFLSCPIDKEITVSKICATKTGQTKKSDGFLLSFQESERVFKAILFQKLGNKEKSLEGWVSSNSSCQCTVCHPNVLQSPFNPIKIRIVICDISFKFLFVSWARFSTSAA